ncbi:MAG: NAD-dependent DNA ligase LigA, partial [Clostridiales bacterium]|nr:NAD-dependent DNA ligase LigA [Clostridiales bacterium]
MSQTNAKERIIQLRHEIGRHNDLYYNQDAPEISDAAYDLLVKELRNFERQYPELADKDSPTQKVGGAPQSTFAKVEHAVPMLSLQDVFSQEEVQQFLAKNPDALYCVEDKVDGLSISILYQKLEGKNDCVLVRALTRGDSRFGEDVTENVKTISNIPRRLNP